uniref:C2H2-type domain-containing protein n=1 Tax=Panagrolaimus sp. JU765 TaxID=591449 RepID=A0AC34Q2U7_9BILA
MAAASTEQQQPILTDDNLFYYHTNTNLGSTTFNGNINSTWTYEETNNNGHFEPFTAAVNTWTGSAFHPPALNYNQQNILDNVVTRNHNNDLELKTNLNIQNFVPSTQLPCLTQQIHENHSSTSPTEENTTKIYSCHRCGKQYCRKSTLKAHVKHHLGERPFICQLKTNLNIQNFVPSTQLPCLTQQIQENHSSSSPTEENTTKIYSCHRCGKQYCRKSTLKAHVKHHLGERPFICQICGKTFSQAANLTAHRRVHTGEKPFSCSICLRPFSQSSSLVTHKSY